MADSYDVIVLGAGPTGENAAARAVRGGLTAVVAESGLVGGECSYWACMPSKGLLRPIAAVSEANHVGGAAGARLDPPAVLARRDSFAHHWKDDGQVEWLKNAGIVDDDSKTILGVTLAGPGVGEMIHAATVAIAGEVPLDRLWHAVPSYPTMSELWLRLLEAYGL